VDQAQQGKRWTRDKTKTNNRRKLLFLGITACTKQKKERKEKENKGKVTHERGKLQTRDNSFPLSYSE
jgi:hypothetical protein